MFGTASTSNLHFSEKYGWMDRPKFPPLSEPVIKGSTSHTHNNTVRFKRYESNSHIHNIFA